MPTLKDVAELLGPSINATAVNARIWPTGDLVEGGTLSIGKLIDRFGEAGARLRAFRESAAPTKWASAQRTLVTYGMKARVLDPAVIRQLNNNLCGPLSVAFLFAARNPADYVRFVADLFHDGEAKGATDRVIKPGSALLEGDYPAPNGKNEYLDQADWIIGTALRDDENWALDLGDDNPQGGLTGLTTAFEMHDWVRDVLNCTPDYSPPLDLGDHMLINGSVFGPFAMTDEIEVLRDAANAVAGGGVAFLAIDSRLISSEGDKVNAANIDADQVRNTSLHHRPGGNKFGGDERYSVDDVWPWPDHWVVMLGDLVENGDQISFRIWSWGAEYMVKGPIDEISEYIYTAVTGIRRYDG